MMLAIMVNEYVKRLDWLWAGASGQPNMVVFSGRKLIPLNNIDIYNASNLSLSWFVDGFILVHSTLLEIIPRKKTIALYSSIKCPNLEFWVLA
jgi:hypothetical protein